MFSTIITLAIVGIAGVLIGMILGHYITLHTSLSNSNLKTQFSQEINNSLTWVHERIDKLEDSIKEQVPDIKSDLQGTTKNAVKNNITTIEGQIKQF